MDDTKLLLLLLLSLDGRIDRECSGWPLFVVGRTLLNVLYRSLVFLLLLLLLSHLYCLIFIFFCRCFFFFLYFQSNICVR